MYICLYRYISVFEWKSGPKLRNHTTCSIHKMKLQKRWEIWYRFSRFHASSTPDLRSGKCFGYSLPHEKISIFSEAEILFKVLCMRPLWNLLYNALSTCMLSKKSTQFVPNILVLRLLKEFGFLKKQSPILFPMITHMYEDIGKATCTFYAISQHKM